MTKKNDLTVIDAEPKREALPVFQNGVVAVLEIGEPERALAAYLEVDLNAALDVLKRRLRVDSRTALLTEIAMGLRLMVVKAQLPHGEFGDALIDLEIPERTARSAMQTARAYAAEGDARRREQLLEMGKAKAVLLLSAKPEIREEILGDPELSAQMADETKREMERRIKDLQAERDTAKNQAAALQHEVNILTRTQIPGDGEFDARTFEVRQECAALEYAARVPMDDLETLFEQLLKEQAEPQVQTLRMRSLGLAVGAALARAQALFDLVRRGMEDDMPVQPHGDLLLSAEEKDRLDAGLTIIRQNHERKKGERKDEATRQAAAHQKGPGRRVGSKTRPKDGAA